MFKCPKGDFQSATQFEVYHHYRRVHGHVDKQWLYEELAKQVKAR